MLERRFCRGQPLGFDVTDAHVHPTVACWLKGAGPHLERTVTAEDLFEELGGAGVGSAVLVEVGQDTELEQGLFIGMGNGIPAVSGLVMSQSLTIDTGLLEERLAMLVSASCGKLKGTRTLIQDRPDALEFINNKGFRAGVATLGRKGLRFDVCIRSYKEGQMQGALELVRACPDTTFVLDHCGKPRIESTKILPAYADWISELSQLPNVFVKVSALADEVTDQTWKAGANAWKSAVWAHIAFVIEAFGLDRSLWAGDWPVSSGRLPYEQNLGLYLGWAESAGLTLPDKRQFFSGTATKAYGLEKAV